MHQTPPLQAQSLQRLQPSVGVWWKSCACSIFTLLSSTHTPQPANHHEHLGVILPAKLRRECGSCCPRALQLLLSWSPGQEWDRGSQGFLMGEMSGSSF